MPAEANIQAAISAAADVSAPAAEAEASGAPPTEGQASTAGSGTSSEAEDPRKVRRELSAEKLEALRQRNAERKASQEAERLKTEAAEHAAKAKAEREAWEGSKGDWRKRLEVAGIDPTTAFSEMVQEAQQAGTPEAMIAALEKKFEAKLQKELDERIVQIKEEAAHRTHAAELEAATVRAKTEFRQLIQSESYAALRADYDDDELEKFGDQFANQLQANGESFTLQDIADGLLRMHSEHTAKVSERRSKQQAASGQQSEVAQAAQSTSPTVNGTQAKTAVVPLSNQLATGVASSTARTLNREQRIQRAIRGA